MRPLFVGTLTEEQINHLKQGLRSPSAFTVRRSQILLHSEKRQTPRQIAAKLHCSDQTVREAIRAFEREGLDCLREKSHARHDQQPQIDERGCTRLQEVIRHSPREFGYETSIWTRPLLAELLHQEGYTGQASSPTAITVALQRVDRVWQRAKQWVRSPDPHYAHKKNDATS